MSKYLNKKVSYQGMTFDSKKEFERYLLLSGLERVGKIKNLRRQVPYTLIDKSKYGRKIAYIADFVYEKDGVTIVEDVKSEFTRKDKVYRLKRRIMQERYNIEIYEFK